MKTKQFLLTIFSFASAALMAQEFKPEANPAATVVSGNARFTVLSPRVIRMEWSADAKFTDNASLTFVNRNLPVPAFTKKETNGVLQITTDAVKLKYKIGSGKFTQNNLSVDFIVNGKNTTWKVGMQNTRNLLGTTRTLDGVDGAAKELEQGIISRDGWYLIDDSERPLFDNSEWAWVMARPGDKPQDLYLFAYDSNYKIALKDYTDIAGKIAMPPRFSFGAWWSRYREYTDTEFRELVGEFKTHDVPLDVFVIDIDWHVKSLPEFFKNGQRQRDQAGEDAGWTGFTWNKDFFPSPEKFLKWTNEQHLKTCLNLHPASGIQPFEEVYPEMAKAMGIDPATKKFVPFDITDKKFATNYMNLVLHPIEKAGVDFWWLDWQQWGNTNIPGVNPTFYLNYVHYSDMERQDKVRPLIFHRWGGLGNHRYQIGFSGDTHVTWKSLDYQPYFTSTAANVGFGYWSHDIGGHQGDAGSPELYTRWIQWGIFSPIFRTHATSEPQHERRIWAYPLENFQIMRDAYLLRYSLVPYLYNEARNTYETGVSTVHPMYYDYPKDENAYSMPNQYMFGRDMIAHPITKPIDNGSIFLSHETWLPEGKWYECSTGSILEGNKKVTMPFTLGDIPVFVKEGAIIPMQSKVERTDESPLNPLILSFYPGEKGALKLYEDEGNNNNFKKGAFTYTPVTSERSGNAMNITIAAAEGSFPGMLSSRGYELRFPCSFPPISVTVNGQNIPFSDVAKAGSWIYSGNDFETTVYVPESATNKAVSVQIQFPDYDQQLLSGKKGQLKYIKKFETFRVTNNWNNGLYNASGIISLSQLGQNLDYNLKDIKAEVDKFDDRWNNALLVIQSASETNKVYRPYYELLKKYGNIAERPEFKNTASALESGTKAKVEFITKGTDKIYYTTDGSVPTRNSQLYTKAVETAVPVRVNAIACPEGNGVCSSAVSKIFYDKNKGLSYSLYKGTWNKIPDFNKLTPVDKGYVPDFDLSKIKHDATSYGVEYNGSVNIPADGKYTFYIGSDDGSKLYINNELIIDNDGLHGFNEKSAEITVKKGQLPIRVEYFQENYGDGLSVEFSSDKIAKTSLFPSF
ncbi:TIM-barrel domain-containing protein [Flavobacterium aquicola]|uniref:Alpha-glucosidase (Family GH31 glycosyl hydrolase) n=1 Tax=Flavobacterium aquicola TaxID=1682742 RepID=A0A3E0EAK7_9FLAO|nr:TIM-barrel domain-containing protein [Flavobacterium aquicola]REG94783.1 alpha-glucosidase (family GH31 glycosyl hydrolase) [Flavobacterium aquicola]